MSRHHRYDESCSSTTDIINDICKKSCCKSHIECNNHNRSDIECNNYDRSDIESDNSCNNSSKPHKSNNCDRLYRDDNNCQMNGSYQCERYDPGTCYFNSVITPLTNLTPHYSGLTGSVEFRMRRKNKTVTLQWEPFTGTMAASGVAFLSVMQSIWNTPPYPVSMPIYIRYKDVNRITNITIDPSSTTGNIKFYLNTDGTGSNVAMGDAVYVYASTISWIVD